MSANTVARLNQPAASDGRQRQALSAPEPPPRCRSAPSCPWPGHLPAPAPHGSKVVVSVTSGYQSSASRSEVPRDLKRAGDEWLLVWSRRGPRHLGSLVNASRLRRRARFAGITASQYPWPSAQTRAASGLIDSCARSPMLRAVRKRSASSGFSRSGAASTILAPAADQLEARTGIGW